MPTRAQFLPVISLIIGAAVWGVIWYPYRVLNAAGIGAIAASVITYAIALAIGLVVLRRHVSGLRLTPTLVVIALAAGGCNIGYVVGTLHGEVMRVLLLFYLAPLWTVLLAYVLLGERLTPAGAAVIVLSLVGAATMLWHPQHGAPWPRVGAEWVGLAAGFLFALTNVLIRRACDLTIEVKSLAVFVGAIVIGSVLLGFGVEPLPALPAAEGWLILGVIGLVLLVVNLIVQFGLMGTPANRAIVILLSELVFAAVSSWLLAGETMGAREWVGGTLIAAASVFSARMESPPQPAEITTYTS